MSNRNTTLRSLEHGSSYFHAGVFLPHRSGFSTSSLRLKLRVHEYKASYLPAATKLGQGNIFTGVCLSTGEEGCLPQCMLGYTPLEQTPPPSGHHHLHLPGADTPWSRHPREQTPSPQSRHQPPRADTHPPREQTPPGKQTSAYGQRAAGTHPTGMHSCFLFILKLSFVGCLCRTVMGFFSKVFGIWLDLERICAYSYTFAYWVTIWVKGIIGLVPLVKGAVSERNHTRPHD